VNRSLFTAATLSMLAVGLSPIGPATAASTYGDAITVAFGTNASSQTPVSVDLPAPSAGTAVTKVIFSWQQPSPTYTTIGTGRYVLDTPWCVANETCHADTTLSTARMKNSNITSVSVGASDGVTFLGGTTRQVPIDNPKPTVSITTPGNYSPVWENVTVAAEAAPSSANVPLKGVRFYVRPTGREDDPYVLDETAPYSIDTAATDIASPGASGMVWAVAEDVQGNLSASDEPYPMRRTLTVAPPPEVRWTSPSVPGQPIGGMSSPALLAWRARIPDVVPSSNGMGRDYIKSVEILIDGEHWATWDYDQLNWYNPDETWNREVSFSWFWDKMTPGRHVGTLIATTGWGSVASLERAFVVTDGAILSPITIDGRTLKDGFVVTAGTVHDLRYSARGKVDGSAIQGWDILDGDSAINDWPRHCSRPDWWNCPNQVSVHGQWLAPRTPGDHVLRFGVGIWSDASPTETTRTIYVQPAGRLGASASASQVPAGRAVTLSGRLVRADTGTGVRNVNLTLQWRASGTSRWQTLLTRTTDVQGRAQARSAQRRTGSYRWKTVGDTGRIGPARSPLVTVRIR
jgi:hypothetical protein